MKKRILIGLSIVLCLILMATPVMAAGGSAAVSSAAGAPGSTVYLTVSIEGFEDADTLGISVSGDLALDAEKSSWLLSGGVLEDFNGSSGVWTTDEKQDLNGDIAKLAFVVPDSGTEHTVSVAVRVKDDAETLGTVSASGKIKPKWNVAFANMSLSNSLAMNFAFAQGNETDWTGYHAKITKTYADGRPDAVVTLPVSQWGKATIGGVPHYTISFKGIAAKEMGDEIRVCIYDTDGEAVSNVWTDSALKYALRAYGAANATEKEKRMLIDMLNYGAAAQQLFGYDADHLVTAELTEEQKAMATQDVEAKSSQEKGANYLGTNLSLESEIRINMAFKGVTEGMYAKVSLTNHAGRKIEEVAQMEIEGSTGIVRVNQIAVADGRTMVTVTVYKADGSVHGSVVDSLEGYISRVIDKEQDRAELYKKILMFADSTYNFKHG